ncbi:DUF4429 domain-containing protein [Actinoplanes philippinensis]
MITGIASGAADLDRDGRITADELYDYVYGEVVKGPSPQRPRRLGSGEGALVVADALRVSQRPAEAASVPVAAVPRAREPRPTALVAKGVMGWVSFDGQWVVIGKDGVGHIYQGERRYHVSQLSGVAVKPATRLHYGYLQVILPGVTPAPIIRFGLHAGRPPMSDDDSLSFAASANGTIAEIRDALEEAIGAAHGIAVVRPARSDRAEPSKAREKGDTRTGLRRHASGDRQAASLPTPTTGRFSGASVLDVGRDDDQHRGHRDGARVAAAIPLAVLDDLGAHQFDVVRWLTPWRHHWQQLLSRPAAASSVPPWLIELAKYLGGHVAPPGSDNPTFIPAFAYVAGFCSGVRDAFSDAVTEGLLPPDRATLTWWMTQPADWLRSGSLMAEATIGDLAEARRRARRVAARWWAARVVLWTATGVLLLMEIVAIVISLQGGWTDETGGVAADQTANALLANLGCGTPLIILVAVIVVDLKRSRRNVPAAALPHEPPPGGREAPATGR